MTDDLRVFDAISRVDPSPSLQRESTYAFLNRVAGEYWRQPRELIEAWVANYPTEHRAQLIGQLRSDNDRHFAGALWELYLHEVFVRAGFSVAIHPTMPTTSHRPDFRVSRDAETFYVEAKSVFGATPTGGAGARKQALFDVVNALTHPRFAVSVDINAVGPTMPRTKTLRNGLLAWLDSLDPEQTRYAGVGEGSEWEWTSDGWNVLFRPIPLSSRHDRARRDRLIAIFGPPIVQIVDDASRIRHALTNKGHKYGELDHPLIVALNVMTMFGDDDEVASALYGAPQITFSMGAGNDESRYTRGRNGYWFSGQWAHRHVSGILVTNNLAPHNLGKNPLTYWVHPNPTAQVAPLDVWRVADPSDGEIRFIDAVRPLTDLLGLPRNWPAGEPFPHLSLRPTPSDEE